MDERSLRARRERFAHQPGGRRGRPDRAASSPAAVIAVVLTPSPWWRRANSVRRELGDQLGAVATLVLLLAHGAQRCQDGGPADRAIRRTSSQFLPGPDGRWGAARTARPSSEFRLGRRRSMPTMMSCRDCCSPTAAGPIWFSTIGAAIAVAELRVSAKTRWRSRLRSGKRSRLHWTESPDRRERGILPSC